MNFFINIEFSIHRKGAKHAKIISFMFAAERTAIIKDYLPEI